MKKLIFTGSCAALVTPMHADGRVNFTALKHLLEVQIEQGSDAVCVCGTTGEASTLTDQEHLAIIRTAVETVRRRIPVIAGTGSNDTRHAIVMSRQAKALGADALLLVTPYYNKTSQDGLIRHFTAIVNEARLPAILYNVPSRTGVTIHPETYAILSREPLIVAAKEASGDLASIARTAALCGDSLTLYSGNDDQIVPLLSLGGKGVISVLANLAPAAVHRMCRLYLDGRVEQSRQMQLNWLEVINALFCDVNPAPVKAALNMMGLAAGPCRLPLAPLAAKEAARLRAVLEMHGLLSRADSPAAHAAGAS